MDESSVTGESDLTLKCTLDQVLRPTSAEENIEQLSPILLSGSTVNEGTA